MESGLNECQWASSAWLALKNGSIFEAKAEVEASMN